MQVKGFDLLLQDFCEECPYFEAEVETFTTSNAIEGYINAQNNIRCKNRGLCASLSKRIEKKLKEESQNEKENSH